MGRIIDEASSSFASTARLATKYRFMKSGRMPSTKSPPGTFGHPASAADVKQNTKSSKLLDDTYSVAISIALKAVKRVIVSYVDSTSGIDLEPDTNWFNKLKPESSSNNNPMQCTIPVYPPSARIVDILAFLRASPCRKSISNVFDKRVLSSSSDSGGSPRRDNEVTWKPSARARLQTAWPRNPVPPSTRIFPQEESPNLRLFRTNRGGRWHIRECDIL